MTAAPVVHRFESFGAREGDAGLRANWIRDCGGPAPAWVGAGHCPACGSDAGFMLVEGVAPDTANLREDLLCAQCRLSARVRAAFWLLRRYRAPDATTTTYFTEQATPTFAWAQSQLPGRVIGSEFEPDPEARARLAERLHALGGHGDIAFADVTALEHGDATLDAILSFDVLEHVPDYLRALAEFRRVLREDGLLVATFPFTDAAVTRVRARLRDGAIEHLCEPEFHGDPLGGGVLCWYHFGWDILDAARAAGFGGAMMAMPSGPRHGLPYGLWTLVASPSARRLREPAA